MAWVERTSSGRWIGRYKSPDRKNLSAGTYRLRKEALAAAQGEERKIRNQTWVDPTAGVLTFSDDFERHWIPTRHAEHRTIMSYWSHYNASLKDECGGLALRDIHHSHVQGWMDRMVTEAEVKPYTAVRRFALLQQVLAGKRKGPR